MDLKRSSFAIGWKSELKVVKDDRVRTYSNEVKRESLRLDEPLIDDFMATRDHESFKRFCIKYGFAMLVPLIRNVKVPRGHLKDAYSMFDGRTTAISENELAELWTAIEDKVKALQDDVKKLQQEQERDSGAFLKLLNKGLKPVHVRAIGGDEYNLVIHGKDLKAAMYLQIILAGVPLAKCEGCPNVFLRTRPDRKYCSSSCQRSAHKRQPGELIRRKNQVRARFYRLCDKDSEQAKKIEAGVLGDLNNARTLKAVTAIEKHYHLEKQRPGRKPTSLPDAKVKG